MADNKTYPVIFNDGYSHDGIFIRGQYAELNQEQYDCAKVLKVSWDQNKPLITDTEKQVKSPAVNTVDATKPVDTKKDLVKP